MRIIPNPKDSNIYRIMCNYEDSTPSGSHQSFLVDDSRNMLSLRDKSKNDIGINFATACGKITLWTYFIDFQKDKRQYRTIIQNL